jgi:hypothetical protein
MSTNAGKKKGNGKKPNAPVDAAPAPAAAPPSVDAIMELLGSRIDSLEGPVAAADQPVPTAEEKTAIEARITEVQAELASKSAAESTAFLLDLFRTAYQQQLVATRQLASSQDKLLRASNQKKTMESLCKSLQAKNQTLVNEVRVISVQQAKEHQSMRDRFSSNLADIQSQLTKHSDDRLAQAKENEALRENLAKLLKFDGVRQEHFDTQLKTKELEIKLSEAKLAQQTDLAAQEVLKTKLQSEKIDALLANETALRAQLASYSDKFSNVQETLTKSNSLFKNFKDEMESTSAQLKKLDKEKQEHARLNAESQLKLIKSFEEKSAVEAELERERRKNQVLSNLCKSLTASGGGGAAAASAKDAPASE